MLIYDDFSKKCYVIFNFFFLFWKVLTYLVCVPSFITIKSSEKKKKVWWGWFHSHHASAMSQNELVGIGLVELTETSVTLSYKSFLKHCILKTILHRFSLFTFVWKKIFCPKNWAVFYIFWIWFGPAFGVTVLKVLCFWCTLYKIIGN